MACRSCRPGRPELALWPPPAAAPGADEELVRRWEGRACRNVFAASLDIARPKFDPASGMLVPDATQARVRTLKTSGGEVDEGVRLLLRHFGFGVECLGDLG